MVLIFMLATVDCCTECGTIVCIEDINQDTKKNCEIIWSPS